VLNLAIKEAKMGYNQYQLKWEPLKFLFLQEKEALKNRKSLNRIWHNQPEL
jgi:hypothetical protein